MIKKIERIFIQNRAEKKLMELGFSSLPIDPCKVAEKTGITVRVNIDTESGVSGMLIKSGDNFGILYATYLNNTGFENFSIAHELGHYFLDGHSEALFNVSQVHISQAGFVSYDKYEQEADVFAASLLMPENLVKDQLWKFGNGLIGVESLANTCYTSLVSSAIRFAELTEKIFIAIVSTGNIVDYCCFSKSVWKLKGIEPLKKGMRIPKNTATTKLENSLKGPIPLKRLTAQADVYDWFETSKSYDATEEVINLGKYGKNLTILSI